jgi:hypothetical protein
MEVPDPLQNHKNSRGIGMSRYKTEDIGIKFSGKKNVRLDFIQSLDPPIWKGASLEPDVF